MSNIGFVGTGIIGRPMAGHLHFRSRTSHRAAPKRSEPCPVSRARSLGVSLPSTATAQELFNACDDALDHSAMIKALEGLAGHELG